MDQARPVVVYAINGRRGSLDSSEEYLSVRTKERSLAFDVGNLVRWGPAVERGNPQAVRFVSNFKESWLTVHRTRERALLVAKQFGL